MSVERKTTQQLLLDSLMDLCQTIPFDKISVQAIAKNCGVSVRTFYNYFQDKYDLMAWTYSVELQGSFNKAISNTWPYYRFQLECINRMTQQGESYVNIMANSHGRDSARIAMRRANQELLLQYLLPGAPEEDKS